MAEAAAKAASRAAAQGQARRRRRSAATRASPRCAPPRPHATLIVDANEGWDERQSRRNLAACARCRRDAGGAAAAGRRRRARSRASSGRSRSAPTKACTTAPRSPALAGKYDAVNIKLDKAGGLTEALAHGASRPSGSASPSWSAAWWRPRWRWRRPCCWRSSARYRRSRRPAVAGERPPRRAALRRQPGLSAHAGAVGLSAPAVRTGLIFLNAATRGCRH